MEIWSARKRTALMLGIHSLTGFRNCMNKIKRKLKRIKVRNKSGMEVKGGGVHNYN
jgi:hypothetical protein